MPRQRTARIPVLIRPSLAPEGSRTARRRPFRARLVALGLVARLARARHRLLPRVLGRRAPRGAADRASASSRPFEVAGERVARPFRDAYGWTSRPALGQGRERGAPGGGRGPPPAGRRERDRGAGERRAAEAARVRRGQRFPDDYERVATRVIVQPQTVFRQEVVVAAGSKDGIRIDDPVVTPDGLVGTVTEVTPNSAQVRLLTDQQSAVSALVLETQARGDRPPRPERRVARPRPRAEDRARRGREHRRHRRSQVRQVRVALPVRHPDRRSSRASASATSTSSSRSRSRRSSTSTRCTRSSSSSRSGGAGVSPADGLKATGLLLARGPDPGHAGRRRSRSRSGHPDVVLVALVALALLRGPMFGASQASGPGSCSTSRRSGRSGSPRSSSRSPATGRDASARRRPAARRYPPLVAVALGTRLARASGRRVIHFMLGQGDSAVDRPRRRAPADARPQPPARLPRLPPAPAALPGHRAGAAGGAGRCLASRASCPPTRGSRGRTASRRRWRSGSRSSGSSRSRSSRRSSSGSGRSR